MINKRSLLKSTGLVLKLQTIPIIIMKLCFRHPSHFCSDKRNNFCYYHGKQNFIEQFLIIIIIIIIYVIFACWHGAWKVVGNQPYTLWLRQLTKWCFEVFSHLPILSLNSIVENWISIFWLQCIMVVVNNICQFLSWGWHPFFHFILSCRNVGVIISFMVWRKPQSKVPPRIMQVLYNTLNTVHWTTRCLYQY